MFFVNGQPASQARRDVRERKQIAGVGLGIVPVQARGGAEGEEVPAAWARLSRIGGW
jgi:hypothetical protein